MAGSTQSQIKKAAVHRDTPNVGNLRDTGHLTAPTPPAAQADNRKVVVITVSVRSCPDPSHWQKGDFRLLRMA
jgi:hypothetical protein